MLCSAEAESAWCCSCEKDLLIKDNGCPVCANVSPGGLICGHCLKAPPQVSSTIVPLHYQYPTDHLIRLFKYKNCIGLARPFARLIVDQLLRSNKLPDLIIPVPLHKSRQRQRGYNQSLELAKQLGKHLNIKTDYRSCKRIKNTAPQSSLSFKERSKNIIGAFSFNGATLPDHIAIIDDVITSGATINELAKMINPTGDKKIEAWAVAKA